MKRLNPKTGLPFIRGTVREDGYIFESYFLDKIKKDGFYVERWSSPLAFKSKSKRNSVTGMLRYNTLQGRAGYLLRAAKKRASKSNAEVTITQDWIEAKLNSETCEVTGLPFQFTQENKHHKNPYSPSLDRIDSRNKNYTPENTRVVLYLVNCALNEFGLDEVKPILQAMLR